MGWVGDLLKAGINATGNTITFNKAVKFANTATFESTTTVPDGTITTAKLSAGLQTKLLELTITDEDQTDGTSVVSIQATDVGGTDAAEAIMIHLWVSATELGAESAITGITVDTGTELTTITANAEALIVSSATGLIELTLDNGGAGSFWLNADFGGFITSKEITVTSV